MRQSVLLLAILLAATPVFAREYRELNGGWRFQRNDISGAQETGFDDAGWQKVVVPHTWVTWATMNAGDYYKGPAWYRRDLEIGENDIGKRLFLRFAGVASVADVYINGQKIGSHQGGYSAFCFEITGHVKAGMNILAVRADNSYTPECPPYEDKLFARLGGIYRQAWLLITDEICITPLDFASPGIYLKQENVSAQNADVDVLIKISNGGKKAKSVKVSTTISDADGKTVASSAVEESIAPETTAGITGKLNIASPTLWNGRKNPYLYRAVVELSKDGVVLDRVEQPLGLRFYHVDADKGFFLNGEYLDLHGVCRHQEWAVESAALTDEHHRKDVELIMEMGATAVRLAHYQQAETFYSLCDKNGLVVWAEIPLVSKYQETPEYLAGAKQILTELIRQNYNHPSICFWGLYNECSAGAEIVRELNELAKKEDPSRLTTAGSNKNFQEKHTVTDLICWNKYYMWYGKKNNIMAFGDWADELHAKNPEIKFGVSEYGAGGCIEQQQQNPVQPDPTNGRFFPEQYMSFIHETVWPQLDARPFLWGKFIWNMFDFSWPGVKRGFYENLNNKGLVTYNRQTKKDPFFYYKANWSDEPVLYITSRRHVKRSDPVTEIKVYSNCENLALKINGKDQGEPSRDDHKVWRWKEITLKQGENTIEVTGVRDGKKLSDSCVFFFDPSQAENKTSETK